MDKDRKASSLPKVTSRTTRAELLKAYNVALEKLEQTSASDKPGPTQELELQTLQTAFTYTDEDVIKAVADLQVTISKALKDLTEKMIAESNKLADLQKAIDGESARLKQVHEIEYQMNSLSALIDAHAERKEAFEKEAAHEREELAAEMAATREAWKREQQEHEQNVKDRDLAIKKQREREEEEYRFKISLERRKDAAEHEAQKAEMERQLDEERKRVGRELAERKEVLSAQENELVELRKRVERFPKELEEAVKKTEAAVRTTLQQEHEFDARLAAKDVETEKRVNAMKIASLEALAAKQQAQITDLTKQLQAATKQVQEMAVKAIESASGAKGRPFNGDSTVDQKKNV